LRYGNGWRWPSPTAILLVLPWPVPADGSISAGATRTACRIRRLIESVPVPYPPKAVPLGTENAPGGPPARLPGMSGRAPIPSGDATIRFNAHNPGHRILVDVRVNCTPRREAHALQLALTDA